jgi:hypothetical protein
MHRAVCGRENPDLKAAVFAAHLLQ